MKHILLRSTLALTLAATAAFAQQSAPQTPSDPNSAQATAPQHGHRHHPFDPHKAAQHLGKKLNLTDDQTAKIEPILADQQQKMATLHSDTSLTPDQRRQQARSIFEQTHSQLASVLTPEQMQQLKSMRRGHGRHQQQGPDQSSAPSAS
jgi:periplasmic protein CpxP/Spy